MPIGGHRDQSDHPQTHGQQGRLRGHARQAGDQSAQQAHQREGAQAARVGFALALHANQQADRQAGGGQPDRCQQRLVQKAGVRLSWDRCAIYARSVRKQHRHGHRGQQSTRGPAHDELEGARVSVATHDDQVDAIVIGPRQYLAANVHVS